MNLYRLMFWFSILMIFAFIIQGCTTGDFDKKQIDWVMENL